MALNILKSPWLPGVLMLVFLIPVVENGFYLRAAVYWNARIASGEIKEDARENLPPEAEFALANQWAREGQLEKALGLLKKIEEDVHHPYSREAAYNAATLYLKKAIEGGGPAANPQLVPLVELAKEGLRSVLRRNPEDWDARYNLERALALLPENEDEDNEGGAPPIGAERAPTTMRGFTLGLP